MYYIGRANIKKSIKHERKKKRKRKDPYSKLRS